MVAANDDVVHRGIVFAGEGNGLSVSQEIPFGTQCTPCLGNCQYIKQMSMWLVSEQTQNTVAVLLLAQLNSSPSSQEPSDVDTVKRFVVPILAPSKVPHVELSEVQRPASVRQPRSAAPVPFNRARIWPVPLNVRAVAVVERARMARLRSMIAVWK
jgi:hypothetical protein